MRSSSAEPPLDRGPRPERKTHARSSQSSNGGAGKRNPELYEVVAAVIEDHAIDEGLHSRFFHMIFELVWPSLSSKGRFVFARAIAQAIQGYLQIDVAWLEDTLVACGIEGDAHAIAARIAQDPRREEEMRAAAKPTLHLLERSGAFEDEGIREVFEAARLVA